MERTLSHAPQQKGFQFGMFLVTIGIVYGDIGTSPLYVMKSILAGNGGIGGVNEQFIIGALSLVIWTITLLTTVKYVLIAMKADNHGEGGIFSLYSIVRDCGKWLVFPAMLGGAALLADGVLTPAVTVTTAVEGLRSIPFMDSLLGTGQGTVVAITLSIILVLFSAQRAGTSRIGKAFGPCMLLWFSFLGATGVVMAIQSPVVLKAFNPIYAVQVLFSPYNKAGLMILGSVFLATTGAEALYSDMGHVGRENIYFSWPFVKACLILNYLGQGGWILRNMGNEALLSVPGLNPFFLMLPEPLRPVAVLLSTMAAIIASQALITGSYTLVSEAMLLDLFPHLEIRYPSDTKGQLYISAINTMLWIGCSLIVLCFRSSQKIEAAYGLSITMTMLMTTVLISSYLRKVRRRVITSWVVLLVFASIESVFFVSSLGKILHGGYVTLLLTLVLMSIMVIWYRGTHLEKKHRTELNMPMYLDSLKALHDDESVPLFAHNLVYLETRNNVDDMDRDILYSILDKGPKRAKAYWFINVNTLEAPYEMNYQLDTYDTDYIFRIKLNLGFGCSTKVNVYLRQIVQDLQELGYLPHQEKKYSIYGPSHVGNFKFCLIQKTVPVKSELGVVDEFILRAKYVIRAIAGSRAKWYGLDNAFVITETVPLIISTDNRERRIRRLEAAPEEKQASYMQ